MDGQRDRNRRAVGRLGTVTAAAIAMVLSTAAIAQAALVSGSLPATGLTYLSTTLNAVNMAGDIRLKVKDNVTVKTTYSIVAPSTNLLGTWHYHNGPVIVTVTVGTLTFYDSSCGSWNVSAGQTYIESPGEVLVARALPSQNTGSTVEWFTTRLYPDGAADPANVAAPCSP